MLKKLAVVLVLIFLSAAVFADDFVQTFNTFYHGIVQLSLQSSHGVLKVVDRERVRSAEIKVLDIDNLYGMLNRQTEVEGPEVFNYKLTIPQVGTKTVLSIEGDKSPDYSPPVNELIEAVKFHHIEMTWDIRQGVFKIARVC